MTTPQPAATVVDLGEHRLIERAQRGDSRAFELLYRQYSGRIHGLCLRMLRDHAAAEDCVQETFLSAWRYLPNFQARSAFGTWLHRIAVNAVLSRTRRKHEHENDENLDDDDPRRGSVWPDSAIGIDLERLIEELPEQARYVVVLQGIYGYTHEETASFLGIAVGTCKAQLHRARKLLARRLDPQAPTGR